MPAQKNRYKQQPSPSPQPKQPVRPDRLLALADPPGAKRPKWRLSLLDLEHAGKWSWAVDGEALQRILAFLAEMEKTTWADIVSRGAGNGRRMHHAQPIESLCPEARARLRQLNLDDRDEMFRFRLGGKLRLWGFLDGDIFYPVWWDPDHKVYPTENLGVALPTSVTPPPSRSRWRAARPA